MGRRTKDHWYLTFDRENHKEIIKFCRRFYSKRNQISIRQELESNITTDSEGNNVEN